MAKHLFVFGLGFTGTRLAQALLEDTQNTWHVSGTVQTVDRAQEVAESVRSRGIDLTKASLDIYVLKDDKLFLYQHTEEQPKLTEVDLCTAFRNVRYILSTVPVDRSTKTDAILQQPMLFAQLKKMALQGEIHWGGYLSTTSVYGNHDGGWVDEDTVVPFDSLRPRGKLRKTAEDAWQFSTGMPMHIFRLPGIYGPGRGPLNRARKGAARCVVKEGQVFSRIHVDDIVGVLMASMLVPNPGRIYNVVDDLPTESYLVTEHACELLGVDRPLRESFDVAKESMSPMAKSFYGDSKRVRSDRIKRELGYSLKYPTYKEGLKAQLDEEDASGWTLVEPLAASKQEVTPSSTGAKSSTTPTTTASSKQQSSHLAQPTIRWLEWVSYAVKAVTQLFGLLSGWVQALSTQLMGRNRVCLLVDNGSLRPEPALQLRKLAESLEQKAASKVSKVIAVSARHSCKIPQEKLDGRSAPVLEELLEEVVKAEPFSSLIVLPYFLGPSKTVTSFLPNTIEAIKAKTKSNFVAKIAAPLVDVSCEGYEESGVVEMLEKAVSEKLEQVGKVPVILVDHGTPSSQVNKVRRGVAAALRLRLGARVSAVVDCSMERREDEAYAFNDPLLENVFDLGGLNSGTVILAYLFLAPGRHAGEGGDVHQILDTVQERYPALEVVQTKLLGEMSDDMLQLLQQRLWSAL